MQTLKFVRRSHGVSKKGKEYDMVEVSDGTSSFTLSVADGVGERIEASVEELADFEAEVHVSTMFGALLGK